VDGFKSFGQFIRRIIVIMIEDAILHPDLPFLVWLMMAHSKGFQLTLRDANRCLKVVQQIASVDIRDPWCPKSTEECLERFRYTLLESLSVTKQNLVRSLTARAAYGGMKGDQSMLMSFAALWTHRFLTQPDLPWEAMINDIFLASSDPLIDADLESIKSMTLKDIPLSAIDFHCTDIVCITRFEMQKNQQNAVFLTV